MFDERSALTTVRYLKRISEDGKARIQDMLFELKKKSEREKFEFDYPGLVSKRLYAFCLHRLRCGLMKSRKIVCLPV